LTVSELEGILKSKDDATNELKKKLSDALLGFEGKGLTITQKNGKVYVSMDESLLFASGSTTVETKGVDALIKVAKVLEQFAPLQLQESYDNAGLSLGNPDAEVTGILITIDVTEEVLEEAIA